MAVLMVRAFQLTLDEDIALFEGLYGRYRDALWVKVQLAPANLHWCSDEALTRLAAHANTMSRCTCICWRPRSRRNMPPGGAAAPRWSTSTASACSGRE